VTLGSQSSASVFDVRRSKGQSMNNVPRKKLVSILLFMLALAALIWALLRVYNMVQDHQSAMLIPVSTKI
jgi:hypothetical protein